MLKIRKLKPTLKHRPAITAGILGTVYAINDEGVARYFDYDREAAFEFRGRHGGQRPSLRSRAGRPTVRTYVSGPV